MTFSEPDKQSPQILKLREGLEKRIEKLRLDNDNYQLSDIDTSRLRGRIAEIKYLLTLIKPVGNTGQGEDGASHPGA